jgi:hypothetical protein
MMSLRGQVSWARITSLGGEPKALTCHSTKKVNNADKPTNLSLCKHWLNPDVPTETFKVPILM